MQVWDVAKKKTLKLSVSVTFDTLYGVSWSHDGNKIAFGCADNTSASHRRHDRQANPLSRRPQRLGAGHGLLQGSSYLVSISRDRSMKLTEVATQRFIDNVTSITPGELKGGLQAVARNPFKNETKVKSTAPGTDMTEKWYDEILHRRRRRRAAVVQDAPHAEARHRRRRQQGPRISRHARAAFTAVTSTPTARYSPPAAVSTARAKSACTQVADGKMCRSSTDIGGVYVVTFRPDGKQIASAGFDGIVRLSDPATGKIIKEFVPVAVLKK